MFREGLELREWLYFVKSFIPSKISVDALTGCARWRLENIVSWLENWSVFDSKNNLDLQDVFNNIKK